MTSDIVHDATRITKDAEMYATICVQNNDTVCGGWFKHLVRQAAKVAGMAEQMEKDYERLHELLRERVK
jgi:prephenate dehydrogenase